MKNKKEYLWALAGRFVPQSIYLITTMILARLLSPDDFGMIGVLGIFFTIASVLMDFGLGGSLIRENKISNVDCSTIFVFNLLISHILFLFLFICSDYLEDYFAKEGLNTVVKLSSFVFIINSWGVVPKSLLQRELKFRSISNIGIISVVGASLGAIFLGINNFGVYALVGYQLINAIISVLLLLLKSSFSISFKFSIASFKKLIPFGLYTTFTLFIDTIYENVITFLFGKYFNLQQAGFLYQAKKIEEIPSHSLITTINSVSFSVLTRLKDSPKNFINEARNIFISITSLVVPILLTISLFSEPIIILLYGEKWMESSLYLSILMFAGIFILIENINRNFIKSLGEVNQLFKYTIIKRIIGIFIILMTILIRPKYVLYAYVVSSFIGYVINSFVYSKLLSLNCLSNLFLLLKIGIPNMLYYFIMIFVINNTNYLIIQILASLFLLIIYTVCISLFLDLNIVSFISTKKRIQINENARRKKNETYD